MIPQRQRKINPGVDRAGYNGNRTHREARQWLIRAVLWDMDGTVLDTLEDLWAAVNVSLRRFGLPEASREAVRAGLGNGAAHLISCVAPPERREEVLAFYKPWYDAHCNIRTRPYPGILPLMERLRARGVRQAIISNKPDPAVQELARAYFPGLLETAVGESETVRRKPNPDAVLSAVRQMGLPLRATLAVARSLFTLHSSLFPFTAAAFSSAPICGDIFSAFGRPCGSAPRYGAARCRGRRIPPPAPSRRPGAGCPFPPPAAPP